jgi:transcriptional regulator with XRE-family HTH domain
MSFYAILSKRKKLNQSDRSFALQLGISQTTLLNWRKSEPRPSFIASCAEALGESPEELFREHINDINRGESCQRN